MATGNHSEMNPDRVQEPGRSQRIHLDSTRGLGYMRGSSFCLDLGLVVNRSAS